MGSFRRSLTLLALLYISAFLGARAHEGECASCAASEKAKADADARIAQLEAQLNLLGREKNTAVASMTSLQEQVKTALAEVSKAKADAEAKQVEVQKWMNEKTNADTVVAQWQKHADELKAAHEAKVAELSQVSSRSAQLEADLAQKEAAHAVAVRQLEESLQAAIAAQSNPNISALFATLKAQAQAIGTSAFEQGKILFDELKAGNTSRLEAWGQVAYSHALTGATWTYTTTERGVTAGAQLIAKEYDEHVPEEYKKKIAEAWEKVKELWKQHVVDAVWAQELVKYANVVNDELKAFLTPLLKKNPQTEFLTDPVYLQLIICGMVGAPLMVLILPLLLCCVGPRKSKASDTAANSSASSKKKKKTVKKPKA